METETEEDPIQLNPTKYGAIRKVVETKTKKDQNQCNDAQYGFIRNNGFFSINFYLHISVPIILNLKRPFLKFPRKYFTIVYQSFRLVYYSILELFGQGSQYISIKFPLLKI